MTLKCEKIGEKNRIGITKEHSCSEFAKIDKQFTINLWCLNCYLKSFQDEKKKISMLEKLRKWYKKRKHSHFVLEIVHDRLGEIASETSDFIMFMDDPEYTKQFRNLKAFVFEYFKNFK